jgi:hypothetical protein
MKHITLLTLLLLLVCSCSAPKYITFGDVYILDADGQIIGQWDDSILNSEISDGHPVSISNGTLLFTDSAGVVHYISGGTIIVDNIEVVEGAKSKTK